MERAEHSKIPAACQLAGTTAAPFWREAAQVAQGQVADQGSARCLGHPDARQALAVHGGKCWAGSRGQTAAW